MIETVNGLIELLRALSLQNPYEPKSVEFVLWQEQVKYNVPFLIHASLYLDEFCKKHKKRRVLFSSRDSCLWIKIFKRLFPKYESIYFFASRFLYSFPTPGFIEYVKNVYSSDAVIVDVNGTGDPAAHFFQSTFQTCPTYLLILGSGKNNFAMMRKEVRIDGVEKMNYDLAGALYDVQGGEAMRANPEYSLKWVIPSHACIEKCAQIISDFTLGPFNEKVLDWAAMSMRSGLTLDKYVEHAGTHSHVVHEGKLKHFHILTTGFFLET